MRLDVYLFEKGLARSRTDAKTLISEAYVTVNGNSVTKPSYDVSDTDEVSVILIGERYASRGALKLEGASFSFDFEISGKRCLDVGASTGGFTDYLLKHGAKSVIAVDSGKGQLVDYLLADERVISIEQFNARYMTPSDLPYVPELAVMDVSFISATCIIPAVYNCIADGADFICLIKPQFEVGRAHIGKGGIVKDESARISALKSVCDFAASVGFTVVKTAVSAIKGGDGNIEYVAHFRK